MTAVTLLAGLAISSYPVVDAQHNIRIDHKSKSLVVWFRNVDSFKRTIRITKATVNWCPIKERLPILLVLKPGEAKTFVFHPNDIRAFDYGSAIELKSEEYDGTKLISEGTLQRGGWGGPSGWFWSESIPMNTTYQVGLEAPAEASKYHVRNLTITDGKKAVFSGINKLRFRKGSFQPNSGEKPKSIGNGIFELRPGTYVAKVQFVRFKQLVFEFEWRPSPWAPWQKESQKL